MRENELDLDAILAEYHAEEQRPAAPAESPAPRRRRAESAPVPQEEPIASPAPSGVFSSCTSMISRVQYRDSLLEYSAIASEKYFSFCQRGNVLKVRLGF